MKGILEEVNEMLRWEVLGVVHVRGGGQSRKGGEDGAQTSEGFGSCLAGKTDSTWGWIPHGHEAGGEGEGDLSGSGLSNWMVGSFLETGNTGKGWDEELEETTVRAILKEQSLKCLADTQVPNNSGRVGAPRRCWGWGWEFPTGGELSRIDVECFVPCLAPRRASKEAVPSFLP